MTEFLLVQTAIDSEEAAQRLADSIVEQRLAACCWVSGPVRSTYWWQGVKEEAREWACSFKTRQELYGALEQAIKALHTYEVPEIIATHITGGNPAYLEWIASETLHP